jgi:hypothetical protein
MVLSPKSSKMGKDPNHPLITGLSHVKTSPKWSFNGRQNHLSPLNGPGPGSYSTPASDTTSKSKRAPGFAFGSASREIIDKQRVPGPGSYAHRPHMGSDGKAVSCTPRRVKGLTPSESPGPGAHNLPGLCGAGPKVTLTPRRGDLLKAAAPGPGAYNHEDYALVQAPEKWSFGTSTRPGIESSGKTPGPGTYNHREHVGSHGQQYSMQSRREGVKLQKSPGPGEHGGCFTQFGY